MGLYAGIDVGSCTTKAVVIDQEDNIVGSHVLRSGIDYQSIAREALDVALEGKGLDLPSFADDSRTFKKAPEHKAL